MFGFQSPAAELDLAKAVRAADIEAASAYRLGRLARRTNVSRSSTLARTPSATAPTPRSIRPTSSRVTSTRQPSG